MKLLVEHPYHCSTNNYYSNNATKTYENFSDFLEDFGDADIDLNLIFRFDIHEVEPDDEEGRKEGTYYAWIFIIHQRKGIFGPTIINSFTEEDEIIAIPLLLAHWEVLKKMWEPISTEPK